MDLPPVHRATTRAPASAPPLVTEPPDSTPRATARPAPVDPARATRALRRIVARACALGAAVVACVGAAGCGAPGRLEPRYVAVHNTLAAMGLAQTGPLNQGSLPEGAEARTTQRLEAGQCYTFVAFGDGAVRDLDVRVLDDAGVEIARDGTTDRTAAARACPAASGDYVVVVAMRGGSGDYTMTAWSGAPAPRSGGAGAVAATADGCAAARVLELGQPVRGDTRTGSNRTSGSCARGNAPEQVYTLRIEQRMQISAVLQSTFDGALYLLGSCGDPRSELACNDDAPDTTRSQLDLTLEPGTYYLVVDGYGEEGGTYDLVVSASRAQPVEAVCSDAAPLPFGRPVTGTTQGGSDTFSATCAGGARSPDRVYRIDVPQRSRVRVRMQSDHDGALHLRSDCTAPTSELACNDDHRDQQHSLITAVLDGGRYYVIADGYGMGQAGNYTLEASVASESGGGATGDQCSAPAALTPGTPVTVDTFDAADDLAGTCGGAGGADVVYRIDVRARSRVRATFEDAEHAGVAYIRRVCTDASADLACVTFGPTASAPGPGPRPGSGPAPLPPSPGPALDVTLDPGSYSLVVDGARADAFGAVRMTVQVDDLAALDRLCRQAPLLRPNQPVNGTTATTSDRFQATCASGAQSNDEVYRIQLQRRSVVRLSLAADYDAALHLRRDCADASTELACNDDSTDNRHSYIETTLDRGTYFVIVDGFRTGNQGTYRLELQTTETR